MKRKDNNSGFFLFWRGAIMQLKITTDYAIRIVYYLACRSEVITASELPCLGIRSGYTTQMESVFF